MDSVGAYEAKTTLAALLDRVAHGEEITITRHGVPAAVLVPPPGKRRMQTREAIADIRKLRKGNKLNGVSIRELIEEGRRF